MAFRTHFFLKNILLIIDFILILTAKESAHLRLNVLKYQFRPYLFIYVTPKYFKRSFKVEWSSESIKALSNLIQVIKITFNNISYKIRNSFVNFIGFRSLLFCINEFRLSSNHLYLNALFVFVRIGFQVEIKAIRIWKTSFFFFFFWEPNCNLREND